MSVDPELDHMANNALLVQRDRIAAARREAQEAMERGDTETAQLREFEAETMARGVAKVVEARDPKRLQVVLAKWVMLIKAYRATGKRRPSLDTVAEELGWSEQTLRNLCRELGIKSWHDVHPIVATAPESWRRLKD
jgi:hypothetical protein